MAALRSATHLKVLATILTGFAVGASAEAAAQTPETKAEAASKVYLPEGFPETLQFPAGSRLVRASGGQPPEYASRTYLVDGEVKGKVGDIAAYFEGMLKKKGFEVLEVEKGFATVIRFDAPGLDDASIQIMDPYGEGKAVFSISLIMEPEPE
ncbi:MAG: hypothetical protein R3C52_10770 [Hyphomonadaceae bacterium]